MFDHQMQTWLNKMFGNAWKKWNCCVSNDMNELRGKNHSSLDEISEHSKLE